MTAPTPFDPDVPLGARRVIIRRNPADASEIEMVEATWGSDPRFDGGTGHRFVRSEGRTFPTHRCLVPVSEFHMAVGDRRYRVTLDGGDHFYIAGTWEPAMADWPLSYRVITVAANPEVAVHQDRHGAIVLRRQVMPWLDGTAPERDLIRTPPAGTFLVNEIGADVRQPMLSL